MIPDSEHNEILVGDTLYQISLNYEWREVLIPFVIEAINAIAAAIDDPTDLTTFENRANALIEDFYDEDFVVEGFVIGDVKWIPHDTIPANWLLCDSTVHDRVDYPDLYAILTEFQIDADTFNVPNLHNRFLLGNESLANPVGVAAGSNTKTLSLVNIPPHAHTMAHTHGLKASNAGGAAFGPSGASNVNSVNSTYQTQATSTPDTGNAGGSGGVVQAFDNMPANVGGRFIIKALP